MISQDIGIRVDRSSFSEEVIFRLLSNLRAKNSSTREGDETATHRNRRRACIRGSPWRNASKTFSCPALLLKLSFRAMARANGV